MSAEIIRASVLVFPVVSPIASVNPNTFSEAQPSNLTFTLSVKTPHITTLFTAGRGGGDPLAGVLHFPDLSPTSKCRNISTLPRTSLYDDLPKNKNSAIALFPVIAFAPWTPHCNKEFLDAARNERSTLDGFFFYSPNFTNSIPDDGNDYWRGVNFKDYMFPIYGMRGREGELLMSKYTEYAEQKRVMTDINNNTGRARIFIEVIGHGSRLPGLWLFLLIVLGVLVIAIGFTSLSMHLLQCRRRRSLRRRVASGEVDLEALGIKRLVVPRRILDKLPMRPYQPGGYEQPSCSICLEDFVPNTTTVRELPCKHVYHPSCIDGFLEKQSSLCPLCKSSALPKGYMPQHLSNATVRRERSIRRQRERALREQRGGTQATLWRVWRLIWGDGMWSRNDTRARQRVVEMRQRTERRTRTSEGFPGEEEDFARGGKFRRALRSVFPGYG
ncbi:hypothetical protein BDD12DRAFT_98353 [Trichophaea hybrida]|nr:hypothetical protein BDD12DRAFT_98353 [Trichophaea hybrida]